MKKILALRVARKFDSIKEIDALISEMTDQIKLDTFFFSDLVFKISNHSTKVYDFISGNSVKDFDFVHFVGGKRVEEFESVELFCITENIKNSSPAVIYRNSFNKVSQDLLLAHFDHPIPYTVFTRDLRRFPEIIKKDEYLTFPMIMKDINGTMGNHNFLIDSMEKLEELCSHDYGNGKRKYFVIQEFIPNLFDYRVITMNNKVTSVAERRRNVDTDSHLNNVAKGATKTYVELDTVNPAIISACEKASKDFGKSICAFDVVVNKDNNKFFFLEFSSKFGITTKKISREIPALINYYLEQTK
jgi:glutathione synthase/RimK-type ligase-like ATP-grasp enzyme